VRRRCGTRPGENWFQERQLVYNRRLERHSLVKVRHAETVRRLELWLMQGEPEGQYK
jgi:hypothetical protein